MGDRIALVQATQLTKIYGDGVEIRALDGVDLEIAKGEMVAVMGPSGSGKSTLLHMLGALDPPTSGHVLIDGQDLSEVRDIDRFRSETLGFVFQMHNLIPTLTALENVEVPLRSRRMPRRKRRERSAEMLNVVGLADRLSHLPSQLSGGQRQRVAVARSLVNQPRLLLADEPTGNLDSSSGEEIIRLLTQLNREDGTTILLVTHDRRIARATERTLVMRDGRIVDEHRVRDELTEDLRDLAHSALGQRLINRDVTSLSRFPLVRDGALTDTADDLAEYLATLT